MRCLTFLASLFSGLLSTAAGVCALVCGLLCLIFTCRCMRRAAKVCGILACAALCPLLILLF